jgi:hypothetical protein
MYIFSYGQGQANTSLMPDLGLGLFMEKDATTSKNRL